MSKLTWAGTLAARLGGWTERGQGRLRAIRQGTGPEHGLEVEGPGSRAMSPWHRLLTSSLPRLEEGQDGSSRAQAQDAWLPRLQGSAASLLFPSPPHIKIPQPLPQEFLLFQQVTNLTAAAQDAAEEWVQSLAQCNKECAVAAAALVAAATQI